jgi:peptide/nickel transport system substrate-binding protein
MKKMKTIVFILISLSLLLAACGGGAADQPAAEAEVETEAEVMVEEAEEEAAPQFAVYATHSEIMTNYDPAIEFSNGIMVHNLIYEQLLRYDPKTKETIPMLAESYSVSDDAMTWTFKLREGVKFQNGDAVTANEVKAAFDRTIELGAGAAYIWFAIDTINVVDDYTLEFALVFPNPIDLVMTSGYAAFVYSMECVDEENNWKDDASGCGTGPYALKTGSSDWTSEVIVEKFDDYWGGWPEKHISTVVFQKVTEPATRRQMIEAGEAAITTYLPYSDFDALKDNDAVTTYVEPSFQNLMAMLNNQSPPLDDPKVRQALSYAFPFDEVINTAVGGYARQSYSIVPFGMWSWSEDLPQYQYDLEKAKALLAEAGYEDGFELLLTYLAGDEAEKNAAELYKSELAKIGVELELRSMPWDSQWEMAKATNPEDRQDIYLFYWWPDIPSPYSFLYSPFHTEEEVLFNLAYYYNEDFDALIDTANELTATDFEAAEAMFIESQEMLLNDAASIFIYDQQDLWVTTSNLKGFEYNPAYPQTIFFHGLYFE